MKKTWIGEDDRPIKYPDYIEKMSTSELDAAIASFIHKKKAPLSKKAVERKKLAKEYGMLI